MRAYQNVAIYCQLPDQERKKQLKAHRKRMKGIKGVLKNSDVNYEGTQVSRNNQDSSKISSMRYGNDAIIARNNLVLAKRIFEIMEGPGIISDLLESDPTSNHPGTINFPHRLAEAKRIHNENLIIASRLDAVQPTYYDKSTVTAVRKGSPTKGKHRPAPPPRPAQRDKGGQSRRGGGGGEEVTQHSIVEGSRSEVKPPKSKNVLLEYTKIQKGRVLDVAVIKEPFRDSYSIFGIDIDNGQRYELKLSSEEVSTALEGDLLVTSVDNVEVWMALISKVELSPVEAFSKTPLPNASHNCHSHSESKKPTKPTTLNSSKNQSNPNPRKNKLLKGSNNVTTPVAYNHRARANTAGSSVGSSSAVNGTENDDFSLTTAGGDENQRNDQENETDNDNDFEGDEREKGGERDSPKGYTLDEYYEDHAPLSPLPSQTGFVTSAPSGKHREASEEDGSDSTAINNSTVTADNISNVRTPLSETSNEGGGDDDKNANSGSEKEDDQYEDEVQEGPNDGTVTFAVAYIVNTAIKNVLLHHVSLSVPSQQPPVPTKDPKVGEEKRKIAASVHHGGTKASSSTSTTPCKNPYTSTTFTVVAANPRSHSILYKQKAPTGGGASNKEKGGAGVGEEGDKSSKKETDVTVQVNQPDHNAEKLNPAKEPQKPKESAPVGSNRRPSHRQRQVVDTGNSKRRATSNSVAAAGAHSSTENSHHPNHPTAIPTKPAHNDNSSSNTKKHTRSTIANPTEGGGRRTMSSFRKPVDPMAAVTALAPRVADLAAKTAIKRVGDIVSLFDMDL